MKERVKYRQYELQDIILYIFSIVDVSICGLDDYRCKNGRNCIHLSHVCNSVNDCDDGDDEEFSLCSKFYSQ